MMTEDPTLEEYAYYETQYDPASREQNAWRYRTPQTAKKSYRQILTELADPEDPDEDVPMTYRPSRYEAEWLLSSLRAFYEQKLITDVLSLVKGGKEATVYCCRAHPATGLDLVAAKVYRPHKFRTLRNDAVYRQGREVLAPDGQPVKKTDHRVMRALGKKTEFGLQVAHTSWLMYEYTTLQRLYQAGGAVPRPVAASENALLMGYRGDEQHAAPTLNTVSLGLNEARRLFAEVLRNVALLLEQGLIHGDLSAYNILYWAGKVTIIDFPQVVSAETNPEAYAILRRDIQRTCEYFQRQGVMCAPDAIADELWAHVRPREWGQPPLPGPDDPAFDTGG